MPVTIVLRASDAAGQTGVSARFETELAARRFFDPLAATLIEQRRDLLWSRDNVRRIVQVMKAVSWQPEGLFRSDTAYLRMRVLLRRMDTVSRYTRLSDAQVEDMAQALWDLALLIEDGDLDDARERMQRAQERLSEAMKNGATNEEIARLMQELRDATQDYMRQLSREAAEDGQMGEELSAEQMENAMRLGQDDLQAMMDRIQADGTGPHGRSPAGPGRASAHDGEHARHPGPGRAAAIPGPTGDGGAVGNASRSAGSVGSGLPRSSGTVQPERQSR